MKPILTASILSIFISLCLCLSSCQNPQRSGSSGSVSRDTDATKTAVFSGTYDRQGANDAGTFTLNQDKNTLRFEGAIGSPNCTGQINGEANLLVDRGIFLYTESASGCELEFRKLDNGTLSIVEKGSCSSHGARCSFTGEYPPKS